MSYKTENKVQSVSGNNVGNNSCYRYSLGYLVSEDLQGMISEIQEHKPAGEGDKWHYDIIVNKMLVVRVFNPDVVRYVKEGVNEI